MFTKATLIAIGLFLCVNAHAEDSGWLSSFARNSEKGEPIPKALVSKIDEDYEKAVQDPKLEHKTAVVRHLMSVKVELTQDKPRALKGPTRISTPPGGGVIDLADYVTPLRGSFRLKFILEDDHHQAQNFSRVYFISNAKERAIEGERFGSGCGKYFDVTSFIKTRMSGDGLMLYTADQRYVSVLDGTFVFTSHNPDALMLASVTFIDSRYNGLSCTSATQE